ncbi:Hypothetical Protein FCC1311_047122 [Hondaea fermentalgiana]|uniref:Nudix hydrolase domain-containing protein n=1 Tax=Hondaea fermentalgiana TaxID=2315210 RepID=A0A2R5GDT1_9STRA|nr:Hypothetical Protein FCC1311_047122 [Hondaea fermentalgiana]|eukprot:GBG28489.1 Hypothetical Protein FCC1311_047122 [Hondaea fermentalgiana]
MAAATNPFEVRGELAVRSAATVICVRRRCEAEGGKPGEPVSFARRLKDKYGDALTTKNAFLKGYLKGSDAEKNLCFESGWEVLLGQNEVINWLRSTPEKITTMRYPGEYKLAGGNVDKGETLEEAAKRELSEEFLRPAETQVPFEDIILRPFSVKQTRPIRSRSNLMYNFVAIAEENPWLANLDIDEVNESLRARRREFYKLIESTESPYWSMPVEEKEEISPEVHEVRWVPLEEAVEYCLTSVMDEGISYVNDWQREQFERLNRTRRDPMIMTGAALIELEMFPDFDALRAFCSSTNLDALREGEQWLFPGMTNDDVEEAFLARLGETETVNPSFKALDFIVRQRELNRKQRAASL